MPSQGSRISPWLLAVGATGVILVLTLTPDPGASEVSRRVCLVCTPFSLPDVILNILLFMPLGLALAWSGVHRRTALLCGLGLSIAIELTQLVVPGRFTSLSDVLANTLGTACGILVQLPIAAAAHAESRRAISMAALCSACAAGAIWLTGWLFTPVAQQGGPSSAWSVRLGGRVERSGRVVDAEFGSFSAPSDRFQAPSTVLRAILQGGATLRVRWLPPEPIPRPGSIVRVYDAAGMEALALRRSGRDLLLRYPIRATTFHMDQPELMAVGVIPNTRASDTLDLELWRSHRGYCLSVGGRTTCRLAFTAGQGWMLLKYLNTPSPRLRGALAASWLAVLLAPAGFFVRNGPAALAALLPTVAALGLVPLFTALSPSPMGEWAGVVAGVALGVVARQCVVLLGFDQPPITAAS